MTTETSLAVNDEIRALSMEEIDHVAGAGWFTDLIKKGINYVVGHPQQTVSVIRKIWNWLF